jgi:hypothetical protein
MSKRANTAFSGRQPEILEKSMLFTHSLCKPQDVLSWKMIARQHYEVHRTAGSLRVF